MIQTPEIFDTVFIIGKLGGPYFRNIKFQWYSFGTDITIPEQDPYVRCDRVGLNPVWYKTVKPEMMWEGNQ